MIGTLCYNVDNNINARVFPLLGEAVLFNWKLFHWIVSVTLQVLYTFDDRSNSNSQMSLIWKCPPWTAGLLTKYITFEVLSWQQGAVAESTDFTIQQIAELWLTSSVISLGLSFVLWKMGIHNGTFLTWLAVHPFLFFTPLIFIIHLACHALI